MHRSLKNLFGSVLKFSDWSSPEPQSHKTIYKSVHDQYRIGIFSFPVIGIFFSSMHVITRLSIPWLTGYSRLELFLLLQIVLS